MSLLKLPPYFVVSLFQEWVTVTDFIALDSAFCNNDDRASFHRMLKIQKGFDGLKISSLVNQMNGKKVLISLEGELNKFKLRKQLVEVLGSIVSQEVSFYISKEQSVMQLFARVELSRAKNTHCFAYSVFDPPDVKFGVQIYTDSKDVYIGDINQECERNGQGTYYWTEGDMYEGNWVNNKYEGHGKYTFAKQQQNVFSWTHMMNISSNYSKYCGNFEQNQFHGVGTMYFTNRTDSWSGEWFKGRKDKPFRK
jgi:hypothetical protein